MSHNHRTQRVNTTIYVCRDPTLVFVTKRSWDYFSNNGWVKLACCVCVCVCLSLSLNYIHVREWDLLEGTISSCTIFSINPIRHVGKVSHGCLCKIGSDQLVHQSLYSPWSESAWKPLLKLFSFRALKISKNQAWYLKCPKKKLAIVIECRLKNITFPDLYMLSLIYLSESSSISVK